MNRAGSEVGLEAGLAAAGIRDVSELVGRCQRLRRDRGRPLGPWSRTRVLTALDQAVNGHGWPAEQAAVALLAVAADRHTASPNRLCAPGPWWDSPTHPMGDQLDLDQRAELDRLERQLAELPDGGVGARRAARLTGLAALAGQGAVGRLALARAPLSVTNTSRR